MSDPATIVTTANTATPYITAFAAISAPLITAISLNYATQNKRAERTKALVENKIALGEKGVKDTATKEIQEALDELILLTLQADINKSTKLTRKQMLPWTVGILITLVLAVLLTILVFTYQNFSFSLVDIFEFATSDYGVAFIASATSALGAILISISASRRNRSSREELIMRMKAEQEMRNNITNYFLRQQDKKDT